MSRHTGEYSQDMGVPDVQQHVVQPRSIAPSLSAREALGYYRHMDELFNYDSRSDDAMNTQSLLRLAGNLIQAPHRPACEPEHGSQSVQSSTRQGALARSTATGHVGNPRTHLLNQPSWHGSSPERLLQPCQDRVQSIQHYELSVRHSICPESTRLNPNINIRHSDVADYRHTVLAGHVDGLDPVETMLGLEVLTFGV